MTQTTPITKEQLKGGDILLIVLLSILIPLAVIVVGGGVFIYLFKKNSKIGPGKICLVLITGVHYLFGQHTFKT